jgi:lipopolysaccharide export LptBFGC system permease protein LptF
MQRMMGVIVVGLVLWGVLHAIGAYRFNYNPWRGVVVLASFALFLSWWWWLLRNRQRRLRQ